MKWHPQAKCERKVEAEQRFRDIAEAYDVLVDPRRRQRYDEFGEVGLKFPPPDSGIAPYQYTGDPFTLFTDFFAESNPLAAALHDERDRELGVVSAGGRSKMMVQEEPIVMPVRCTVDDLLGGATKRLSVSRVRLGPSGVPYEELKLMAVPIRAGWKPGVRVHFAGEGNHADLSRRPGDLIFEIVEEAH